MDDGERDPKSGQALPAPEDSVPAQAEPQTPILAAQAPSPPKSPVLPRFGPPPSMKKASSEASPHEKIPGASETANKLHRSDSQERAEKEPQKTPEKPEEPEKQSPPSPARVDTPPDDAPTAQEAKAAALPTKEEQEQDELARKRREREHYTKGLTKTKRGFVAKLAGIFRSKPKVDDDLKDDIEEAIFTADIGAKTAQKLLDAVTQELDREAVTDPDAVWKVIRETALNILDIPFDAPDYSLEANKPYVLLMIGVNGVGKTTTIGKLAARHAEAGRKVLLVAGDTFRAAACEQLAIWAERVGCDIHQGKEGSDPSSVIYDGIARAKRENYDVVLCDTAGRLHTKKELMAELDKINPLGYQGTLGGRRGSQPPRRLSRPGCDDWSERTQSGQSL